MTTSPHPHEIRDRSDAERAVIARFVGELGLQVTVDDFERTFREIVELTTTNPESEDADAEFSADEREALRRAGADFAPLPVGTVDPVERTRVAFAALMLDTISVEETAGRLDRDVSRIRQRIRDRSLWALPGEAGSRLPRIQFADDGSQIPGMGRVLQALPSDLHPIAVLRWLARPHHDFLVDDVPVSPRDWLRAGGHADQAMALADDLHIS